MGRDFLGTSNSFDNKNYSPIDRRWNYFEIKMYSEMKSNECKVKWTLRFATSVWPSMFFKWNFVAKKDFFFFGYMNAEIFFSSEHQRNENTLMRFDMRNVYVFAVLFHLFKREKYAERCCWKNIWKQLIIMMAHETHTNGS